MKISFVIPVFNEEKNIPILYEELKELIKKLNYDSELIFIDDGSEDRSLTEIKNIKLRDASIKAISFEKNYGQSTAFKQGFDEATGDIIITMDADLQNDPHDIPKLISYIGKGYDVAIGYRKKRIDSFKKKITSKIANFVRNKITQDKIKDTGCSLKAFRRQYLDRIKLYNGLHRFLPTLLKMEGAKVIEVKVNHRARRYGKTKYGIRNRLLKPLIDTFVVLWMKKNFINPKIKERI